MSSGLQRITLDFDGSVLSTKCKAEGAAVGFNKKKKGAIIEARMDSAFFSDEIVSSLQDRGIEFSTSVPFERSVELKQLIEGRVRWNTVDNERDYFEQQWKPKSWCRRYRFLFVRTVAKKQQKGPVQLDLFEPYEFGFDFKAVITNKALQAASLLSYHDGRGSQEGVFAELKSHCHMEYVPVRTQQRRTAAFLQRWGLPCTIVQ